MTNSTSNDKVIQNFERIQLIKAKLKNDMKLNMLQQAVANPLPEWH